MARERLMITLARLLTGARCYQFFAQYTVAFFLNLLFALLLPPSQQMTLVIVISADLRLN